MPSSHPPTKAMNGAVCVLGSFNVDIVAKVLRFPKPGEAIMALSSVVGPGGKGCNQATAASQAQARVHFITKVGKDPFSHIALDHLRSTNIQALTLYQSDSAPTGSAIIYLAQEHAENMIAVHPGANITFSADEIEEITPALIQSSIFLVQLENNFDAILHAILLAKAHGLMVMLNPAPYRPEVLAGLSYIDIITPNEIEASLLSGIEVIDLASAKQAAQQIATQGVNTVIITLGRKGVLIYHQTQFHYLPGLPANPVDTTGAGDAFNGALAAALAQGQPLLEAARYAAAFSVVAIESEGAANMPTHEQVLARIASQPLGNCNE